MKQQIIDVTGLNSQQIAILQEIVTAFRAVSQHEHVQQTVNYSLDITEPSARELMRLTETNSSFSFLHDEPELYTLEDGEPV